MSLLLAFRFCFILAFRDLCSGLGSFRFFLASLFLGVAIISAVHALQFGMSQGLATSGREILGGDLSFVLIQRDATDDERQWIESLGQTSKVATLRTMARAGDHTPSLIELKAVDSFYPLLGDLKSAPAGVDGLTQTDGVYGALADPIFVIKNNLKIGDHFEIGTAPFRLAGILEAEPDKLSSGLSFGARVIISRAALEASGLVRPGALIKWNYRLVLNGANERPSDLEAIVSASQKRFPQSGWDIKTRLNAAPQLEKNLGRFSQFLFILGLCALILGGIGIQRSVEAFLERKANDFAIIKALGAPPEKIFIIALGEIMTFALIGSLIGAIAGALLPLAIGPAFDSFGLPFSPSLSLRPFMISLSIGLLISLTFSILPLAKAHDISVSSLFRTQSQTSQSLRTRYWVMVLAASLVLLATIFFTSIDKNLTLAFLIGAPVIGGVLIGVSFGLGRLANLASHVRNPILRIAIGNIARAKSLRQSFVIAIGFAFTLIIMIGLLSETLRAQVGRGLPTGAPSFFLLDIQKTELDRLETFTRETSNFAAQRVPMLRGRVMAVNETPAEKIKAEESASWALESDRGLTFSATLPEGSTLVSGDWWDANYKGEPLVSVDDAIGKGLGLQLGDKVTLNILGRNLTARIANFRKVNWRSLGINFVFVLTPNAFENAPFTYLLSLNSKALQDKVAQTNDTQTDELDFVRALVAHFPDITIVRVKEALQTLNETIERMNLGILLAGGIIFVAANLALMAAVSTGYRVRAYETAILRALGATNRQVIAALLVELSLLSTAAIGLGLAFGYLACRFISSYFFKLDDIAIDAGFLSLVCLVSIALVFQIAILTVRNVLRARPAAYLSKN